MPNNKLTVWQKFNHAINHASRILQEQSQFYFASASRSRNVQLFYVNYEVTNVHND